MTDNHISFVIPAYNCSSTIEEAVDSILIENYTNGDEIIVVNDASTDNTESVLYKLKEKHSSIIIISNLVNKGCPASRNIGIEQAKNPIIFNLDSDNILVPGSITELKNVLIKENADVAAFGEMHYFLNHRNNITHKWVFQPGQLTLEDFLSGLYNPGPNGNFMYTKKSWERIGKYWEYGKGLHEAWGFALKQIASGSKFVVMDGGYYLHRYGHDSLYARESQKVFESSLIATKMITPFLDLVDEHDRQYIESKVGARAWFNQLKWRPIKTKNGTRGKNGKIEYIENKKRKNITTSEAIKIIIRKNKLLFRLFVAYLYIKKRIWFFRSFLQFTGKEKEYGFRFKTSWKDKYTRYEKFNRHTDFDQHYVYHTAWAARVLHMTKPAYHVDLASSIYFLAITSAFVPIEHHDYNPPDIKLPNLSVFKTNILNLPFPDGSENSISCMHVLEHIGLGRYGDELDPEGDIKGACELKRVLARGGQLLLAVPVSGNPRIQFNAHRIYSYDMVLDLFSGLILKEFYLIPDDAHESGVIEYATRDQANAQKYGCGCFLFIKS